MTSLKMYGLDGKEAGTVKVPASLADAEANNQMIKDYIVALRENQRQWSASTKGRSEVVHTTKKPFKQKGTGNARQGSLVSPQFRGGGIVHGPKPKFDQHVRINKKEKKAAIRALIGEKIRSGHFHVVKDFAMDEPKTKTVVQFLNDRNTKGRVLFLGEGEWAEFDADDEKIRVSVRCNKHEPFIRSMRNIPKTQFLLAQNVNGYEVLVAKDLYVTESALKEIEDWLCQEEAKTSAKPEKKPAKAAKKVEKPAKKPAGLAKKPAERAKTPSKKKKD